jgi:hypothetical protein
LCNNSQLQDHLLTFDSSQHEDAQPHPHQQSPDFNAQPYPDFHAQPYPDFHAQPYPNFLASGISLNSCAQ